MGMREKTFAALAVMDESGDSKALLQFINPNKKSEYEKSLGRYIKLPENEKKDKATFDLRSLLSSREFTGLSDVHPGWMWEVLKNEPPRIISVILRYLPSQHTKYLLDYMPASVRSLLPPPMDAFKVPPEIVSIIRSKFQEKFLPMFMPRGISNWALEHLPYLSLKQIQKVFENRGLMELALSLYDMPKQAHRVVMNRLTLEQATKLKDYLDDWVVNYRELRRSAKYAVLEVESSEDSDMNFLEHLGMRGVARAVVSNEKWVHLVRQRLQPTDGYMWQRLVEEMISINVQIAPVEKKLTENIIKEVAEIKDNKELPE